MSISKKLYGYLLMALFLVFGGMGVLNQQVVKGEIQDLNRRVLEDVVNLTVEILSAMDNPTVAQLEAAINTDVQLGKTGFLFVVDGQGQMLIHRKVQGQNWLDKDFVSKMVAEKTGYYRYKSPKTHTWKVAAYRYLPSKDWIVAASYFEDETLARPLQHMARQSLIFFLPMLLIIIGIYSLFIRRRVVHPLRQIEASLVDAAEQISQTSRRITSSMNNLADGATRQAASLQESSAALTQLADNTQETAGHAETAHLSMQSTSEQPARRPAKSSRPSMRSLSRPTCWPSTRPWKPPAPGTAARGLPWSPKRCAAWPSAARRRRPTRPA